ncbi:MAG: ADP-forming succinate--CoA ligase subunit beta [candidate division WOR-3 bacterium]
MNIHESQAKSLFSDYGIPVLPGKTASDPSEARKAALELGFPVVIKALVLAGGRGKAGGVRLASNQDEVQELSAAILKLSIKGMPVQKVYVTSAVDYSTENYVGLVVDRSCQRIVLVASSAGGVEIEEVSRSNPGAILKTKIDPLVGLRPYEARSIGFELFQDSRRANSFSQIALQLYRLAIEKDCSLVEINPLVCLKDGSLLALDAKINFDDNALFRHPELEALRDISAEEPGEIAARAAGLSYVKLDGDIGCVVNGAGLAMATMDLIKACGGEPANFLDIGGSSSPEKMTTAMRILLGSDRIRTVLVNIFGGITRCDDVAAGLLTAIQELDMKVPIVARLVGTNQAKARALLAGSRVEFTDTMIGAVERAVALARAG